MLRVHSSQQRGATLIVVLIILVAILLLGLGASQMSLQSMQIARNHRDRLIAHIAAEAALIDAQRDLQGGRKKHIFPRRSTVQLAPCTASGEFVGLCRPATSGELAVWESVDFMQDAYSVAYGQFTGRQMQTGIGMLPQKLPRYLIERLGTHARDEDPRNMAYRITSMGFGPRSSKVMLQIIYQVPSPLVVPQRAFTPIEHTTPSQGNLLHQGVMSWKEIIDWQTAVTVDHP